MTIPFAVPVHVAVPLLTSVRPSNRGSELDGKLMPPFAVVVAFGEPVTHVRPLIPVHCVPPDHVKGPLIVRLSVPANVPPDWVIAVVEIAPPVEKFSMPAEIVRGPTLVTVTGAVKFAVPPDAVVPLGMLYVPVSVSVPPAKLTVPAPLTDPLSAYVPNVNPNVAPEPTAHEPPHVPAQLPPPTRFSVPAVTCTAPVLLNAIVLFTVLVPVPPDFLNVPPLLLN